MGMLLVSLNLDHQALIKDFRMATSSHGNEAQLVLQHHGSDVEMIVEATTTLVTVPHLEVPHLGPEIVDAGQTTVLAILITEARMVTTQQLLWQVALRHGNSKQQPTLRLRHQEDTEATPLQATAMHSIPWALLLDWAVPLVHLQEHLPD